MGFILYLFILLLFVVLMLIQAYIVGRKHYKIGIILPMLCFIYNIFIFFPHIATSHTSSCISKNKIQSKIVMIHLDKEKLMQNALNRLIKSNSVTIFLLLPYFRIFKITQNTNK